MDAFKGGKGRISSGLKMLPLLLFVVATFFAPSDVGAFTIQEVFESTLPGDIPAGWFKWWNSNSAVTEITAFEGSRSVFSQGSPYWGTGLVHDTTGMDPAGTYLFSFAMKIDQMAWSGSDGFVQGQLSFNRNGLSWGVQKTGNAYTAMFYGGGNFYISPIQPDLSRWVQYSMLIDYASNSAQYFIDGTLAGSSSIWVGVGSNALIINAGSAGPGGGMPAAYFDLINLVPVLFKPPVANAGENILITSENLAGTALQGTASDPDSTALTYRWREGANTLLDWQSVGSQGEAPLSLASIPPMAIGEHTLTLEVSDGRTTAADDAIVTVGNSAPHAAPSGGGTYEVGSLVSLGGQVSDFDGDALIFHWTEGDQVLNTGSIQAVAGGTPVDLPAYPLYGLSIGTHAITLSLSDGVSQPVMGSVTVTIIDDQAPRLSPVANMAILWPPNHKMVLVTIEPNAADNSGLPVGLGVQIVSNEPQEGLGDGDTPIDWIVQSIDPATGKIVVQLRAERSGSGKGREYSIVISATDTLGNTSASTVKVIVPHDKSSR